MYHLAASLTGSASEAKDVVQEVFVGLPEALKRFEGRSGLWPWLRTTAIRCVLMRRRAELRLDTRTGAFPWVRRHGEEEEAELDRICLERAMEALPETYRDIVMLKYVQGLSHEEIAHALGITRHASETRLHRARGLLSRALAGEGA